MTLVSEVNRQRDVFLNPGEFHFYYPVSGRARPERLRTLLGSCVSVVLWHPERCFGGMCHIILPGRNKRDEMHTLDARYADEAMQIFYREVIRAGTLPQQYQTYVVGGGNMYLTESVKFSVGARNVEAARIHLKKFGFIVRSEHTGSSHHRKVELDLVLGLVTVTCNFKRFDLAIPKR